MDVETTNPIYSTSEMQPPDCQPTLMTSNLEKVVVAPGVLTYSETLKQSNGDCAKSAVINLSNVNSDEEVCNFNFNFNNNLVNRNNVSFLGSEVSY